MSSAAATFCSTSRMVCPRCFSRRISSKMPSTICGARPERGLVQQQQPRLRHRARGRSRAAAAGRRRACRRAWSRRSARIGNSSKTSARLRAAACAIGRGRSAEGEVLHHRQGGEDAAPLRHHRHARPDDLLGRPPAERLAGEADLAARTRTSPTMALRVVDLPAPLAPSRATTSPASIARSMPRTARMAP